MDRQPQNNDGINLFGAELLRWDWRQYNYLSPAYATGVLGHQVAVHMFFTASSPAIPAIDGLYPTASQLYNYPPTAYPPPRAPMRITRTTSR